MDEVAISLGILASASTLYGFALAYYIFARTLHEMQEERAAARLNLDSRGAHDKLREIFRRTMLLDAFLLGATVAFLFSVSLNLQFLSDHLGGLTPFVWRIGIGFAGLLFGLSALGFYVGIRNFIWAFSQWSEHRKWLERNPRKPAGEL